MDEKLEITVGFTLSILLQSTTVPWFSDKWIQMFFAQLCNIDNVLAAAKEYANPSTNIIKAGQSKCNWKGQKKASENWIKGSHDPQCNTKYVSLLKTQTNC